ncbi:MAG: dual CXXC motif small (seleno)protein [Desulfovibrionaceae bacterium]|nr:dual CXXC motif small (seleno)protein [Desulfovibrionaceae bacterium]
MGYFPPRQAQTTLPCPHCQQAMLVERSCHEAHMRCPSCNRVYPLQDYIRKADSAMEEFLDRCYLDRL